MAVGFTPLFDELEQTSKIACFSRRKILFFIYDVIVKQKIQKRPTIHYLRNAPLRTDTLLRGDELPEEAQERKAGREEC
jgi:hypothetical protein